jgi:hypothetical protein
MGKEVTGKLGREWLPAAYPCLEVAQEPFVVGFKSQY